MEKTTIMNLPDCYKLGNGTIELAVTTGVGPRVIRYAFAGGENVFAELPDAKVTTPFGDWKPWGGHRLWHAPEVIPRSYVPDNSPIEYTTVGNGVRLTQPVEAHAGIQKEMTVLPDAAGTGVKISHRLTNRNIWPVTLAAWALSIMRGGGVTIIPNEPFKSHDEELLPARSMALWPFTDMADARWTFGTKYLRLRTDDSAKTPQKIGCLNKQGWAGYLRNGTLFVTRFAYEAGKLYPDYGCNCETYTEGSFMEVETLGPLTTLEPGQSLEYVEKWFLFKNVSAGASEASLDAAIAPLVRQTHLA